MNTASKENMHLGRVGARDRLEQGFDLQFPKGEARKRSNVPATFAPLEQEPASALIEEEPKQFWSWYMNICSDLSALELCGLIGAPSGDDDKGWLRLVDRSDLFFSKLARCKAQETDTPGAIAEKRGRLLK